MRLCARASVMTQCTTLTTQPAQMVVTGKVHNRPKRGSCDSERGREAGKKQSAEVGKH